MDKRSVKARWGLFAAAIFLGSAFLILTLGGCASTAPGKVTTGPGTPDETQMQHYEMLVSAIEAKNRVDALAALALLQADVNRWQTNWLMVANAIADQAALTDAVNREDWALANKMLKELTAKYRRK